MTTKARNLCRHARPSKMASTGYRLWSTAIRLVSALGLALMCGAVFAAPVRPENAAAVVRGWLRVSRAPLNEPLNKQIQKAEALTDEAGRVFCHVVHLEPAGYVVVAADDSIEPIVAFSKQGRFDPDPGNPLWALVRADLPKRAAAARRTALAAPKGDALRARDKWQQLVEADKDQVIKEAGSYSVPDVRVAPLVQSHWSQKRVAGQACYNYYTPPYGAGNSDNYYAGCVATAMAQLMRYYQHPATSVGKGAYMISIDRFTASRRLRGGDGAGGAYHWSQMPLSPDYPTDLERQALGSLAYDAGLSVNMDYAADASAAKTENAANAFISTFHYANSIGGYPNDSTATLARMINPNLDAHCPVLLGIHGDGYGHAVVCDGYGYDQATVYHHLNLGWSGNDDAWYALPIIDTGNGTFNSIIKCVYNTFVTGTGEIISGRVLDKAGIPVADATVTATGADQVLHTTITDERGIYALPRIPSSSQYTVKVTKADFTPVSASFSTGKSQSYTAACGNVWGANFTLALVTPPTIIVQPADQVAGLGSSVTFRVAATGTAPFIYTWQKDGIYLSNVKSKIAGATASQLTISAISTNDVGLYSVLVSNVAGQVQSSSASLRVCPTVAITWPLPNALITNASIAARGVAADVGGPGLAHILWKLNKGDYQVSEGLPDWSVPMDLEIGNNILSVKGVDLDGLESPVVTRSFVCRISIPVTLSTTGLGRISGATNGQIKVVGTTCKLSAIPAAGQIFSHWSGTYTSTNKNLEFVVLPVTALAANFISNPFIPQQGNFNGLFFPTDEQGTQFTTTDPTNSGAFSLKLTTSGAFSGRVLLQGSSLPFSGAFDPGFQPVTVKIKTNLSATIQLDPTRHIITGSVTRESAWNSGLVAVRAPAFKSNVYAGRYSLIMEGCAIENTCFAGTNVPVGDCPAAVAASASGAIRVSGSLGDRTTLTQTAAISEDGTWPLFASLYGGKGFVMGWMSFATNDGLGVSWVKPPSLAGQKFYSGGFSFVNRRASLTRYSPPKAGQNVLNWTNGILVISAGNLPGPLTNHISIVNNKMRVLSGDITNLALKISASDGLFTGSFKHPATRATTSFSGVLIQNPPERLPVEGGGWFLDSSKGGTVRLMSE